MVIRKKIITHGASPYIVISSDLVQAVQNLLHYMWNQ